jgi:DNA-binding IclR family transcriptional regulator
VNPGTAAIARALDLLEALGTPQAASSGLGVVRLAELVGAEKSQVSRTLGVLEDRGFVARDPDTLAFRLGLRLYALAASVAEATILTAAPSVLRDLVDALDESAHLSVRRGAEVLTLLSESPSAAIHAPGRVGALTPIATTSAGRVLAIDLDLGELERLGLGPAVAAIELAREEGFAIVREEFEPGLVAVAAPVRDASGRVIAALNVSAPAFRFADRLDEAAGIVVEGAARLSLAVAGSPVAG